MNETKKVIWYLHHYAALPNLGVFYRPYYLSSEFNNKGFLSFVIAASFHHLKTNAMPQTKPIDMQTVDELPFIWLKTPSYQGNGWGRIKNMFSYAWQLWRSRKQLVQQTGKPSIIIVSSGHPFHYIPALWMSKRYGAKLIFEVRDLWPLSLIELLGKSPYHPFILLLSLFERLAYKTADFVVSLLPNAFAYMKQRGLSEAKYHYISNGISVEHSLDQKALLPALHQQEIDKQKANGHFLIGYAGAHGIPNALDDLIKAMILLNREGQDNIRLFLVGQGEQKKSLQQLVAAHQLNNVIFLDAISKNQILSFLEQMDVLYLGWKKKPLYNFGISPNKIFDYMVASKPILQAISSSYNIISEIGCGVTVAAENVEEIAVGMKRLAGFKKNDLVQMGALGAEAVRRYYAYEYLANKYISLFK